MILHALGTRVEGGNFALVCQGFPQLVRVSSDVVRPDNSRVFPERTPVICQIRMVNETPLVPDLERLEEMIADETSIAAARRDLQRAAFPPSAAIKGHPSAEPNPPGCQRPAVTGTIAAPDGAATDAHPPQQRSQLRRARVRARRGAAAWPCLL